MKIYKKLLYNYNQPLILMHTPTYVLKLNENTHYVPRFSLKNSELFPEFPINTPMKFSPQLILKAIQWGMMIQIDYKGAEDDTMEGHQRTIYPMILGYNKDGKMLLRAWHFNGWSVSQGGQLNKEWRLFRGDRILNMQFTGSFFRLEPDGYLMRDKQMARIIGMADFNQIRNNQQQLLDKDKVDLADNVIVNKINKVVVKDLNYNIKLFNPFADNVISKKDASNVRISFAKPVSGSSPHMALIGTSIEPNNTFKVYDEKNNLIGTYRSIKWLMADQLKDNKIIDGQAEYKLYLFKNGK